MSSVFQSCVLISDPHGFPLRGVAPATAAPTVMICPSDKPQPHARSVTFPDDWLPDFDPSMSYGKKCWWVADRIFAAAVIQLRLDADFFWCIESDVAATPGTWQRLILASQHRRLDGIHVHLSARSSPTPVSAPFFSHPTTPSWATHHCFGPVHRFSRRAIHWLAATAVQHRNVYCEIHAPSIIRAHGGSMGDLRHLGWFYNSQCLCADPSLHSINTALLNHPCKSNTTLLG